MEYRRRRRKRARTSFRGSTSGAGKAFVALLVAGGVIYLVSASAAGTWIAQNVMAPVFRAVDGFVEGAAATPTPIVSPAIQNTAPANTSAVAAKERLALPAMTCFALQMGVYQSRENADIQAAALQKQGAGGFVLEDGGRFRVLAAGYQDEASLKSVREQLTLEGLENAAYVMEAPGNQLEVTAAEEQLREIQNGISVLQSLQAELAAAALRFDQQQQSPSAGRETAAALLSRVRTAREALSAMQGEGILNRIQECLIRSEDALNQLAALNTESFVDFSSKMKYTHLYITNEYRNLSQQVLTY